MPRHNHLVELAFVAIRNKGRALHVHANIPWKYHFHLDREAFKTATDLDGLVMVMVNGKRATPTSTCLEATCSGPTT